MHWSSEKWNKFITWSNTTITRHSTIQKFHLPKRGITLLDRKLMSVNKHALHTFNGAIYYYDSGCFSNAGYMQKFIGKLTFPQNAYFFEKTPIYSLYPHIAYIMANDMIQYGTKVLLLLRHPVKRFISSYFQDRSKHNSWNRSLDAYLNDVVYRKDNKFAKYRNELDMIYRKAT
eukprot:995387_1